ncbi:MAG: hypothetical protein IT371_04590 [Deltaproteobacteria bacterium]|nr:hypothetical protein [Deltaproteobacteria bacterium]
MGLFDKKRKEKDEFDSPVEQVNLSAPVAAQPPPPPPRRLEAAPPSPLALAEQEDEAPRYTIDQAIELMRLLPVDNVELVVQVVKKTLESTKVKIPAIIQDATRKLDRLEKRVEVLKQEIREYEEEIAKRRNEIAAHEADHAETTTVRGRLAMAERMNVERANRPSGHVMALPSTPPPTPAEASPDPVPEPKE